MDRIKNKKKLKYFIFDYLFYLYSGLFYSYFYFLFIILFSYGIFPRKSKTNAVLIYKYILLIYFLFD